MDNFYKICKILRYVTYCTIYNEAENYTWLFTVDALFLTNYRSNWQSIELQSATLQQLALSNMQYNILVWERLLSHHKHNFHSQLNFAYSIHSLFKKNVKKVCQFPKTMKLYCILVAVKKMKNSKCVRISDVKSSHESQC